MTKARVKPDFAAAVLWLAALVLADGLVCGAIWIARGDSAPLIRFFRCEGALALVACALAEICFAMAVQRRFAPDQTMQRAWGLISCSAACNLAGTLLAQILGVDSPINPVLIANAALAPHIAILGSWGLVLAGPCRLVILAFALSGPLAAYRDAGFTPKLRVPEKMLLVIIAVYVGREIKDLAIAFQHGKQLRFFEVLNWPVDPTLIVLLAEAMLLRHSVAQTGFGLVGKCWGAFSAGIALTVLGDIGIWATNQGLLPWPWSSVTWFVWLPAAAAFALGPIYQLQAIERALHRSRLAA